MLNIRKPKAFVGDGLLETTAKDEAISEADTYVLQRDIMVPKPKLNMSRRGISVRTDKWKYLYTEGAQDELYDSG